MHSDPFDNLARALAHGATRRQLLKSVAAGAVASLFSTLKIKQGRAAPSLATGEGQNYLPFIRTPGVAAAFVGICGAASRGLQTINCAQDNDAEDCRCIETPEGDLRCGAPPPCSGSATHFCTTSAGCAALGAGYFCDTPGSGNCGDDKQRCLAPCKSEAPCPQELRCGSACCEQGSLCQKGVCFDPVAGDWTGTLTYQKETVGIRFTLERRGPWLTGIMLLKDPQTQEYLVTGALAEASWKTDGNASWKISNDVEEITGIGSPSSVNGQFVDDAFTGAYTFPALSGEVSFQATISLKRAA